MTTVSIQRVGHACGARVTGVDLSRAVPDAAFEAIYKAWLQHQVLVFPGQALDPHSLVAFTRRFGELDDYSSQPFNRHPEHPQVFLLSNKKTNGKPFATYNAGQNWHTDLSYTIRPAKHTCVYCIEKPSVGGDTMFANMYLAYESLSPKMREFLDGLECVHDVSLVEGLDKRGPELSEAESRPILKFLCERSVQPRFTYRHYWSVGDLVLWDNRCLVHLAVGDYDPDEIRQMIRTSSMGDYVGRYLS